MSSPTVSFLIAAYNEESFIREAVDSCLSQAGVDVEVVVTDDGSTDRTLSILHAAFDGNSKVQILSLSRNTGKVAAYNHCFRHSTGDFIAILGGDDVSIPERAASSLAGLRKHGADMVCGDCIAFDSSGVLCQHLATEWFGMTSDMPIDFESQLRRPRVFGGTLFAARALCNSLFPLNEALGHEDWWLPLAASNLRPVWYLHAPMIRYRFHEGNSSRLGPNLGFARWLELTVREISYYGAVMEKFQLTPAQQRICTCRQAMLELLKTPGLVERWRAGLAGLGAALAVGVPLIDRMKYFLAMLSPHLSFRISRSVAMRKRRA